MPTSVYDDQDRDALRGESIPNPGQADTDRKVSPKVVRDLEKSFAEPSIKDDERNTNQPQGSRLQRAALAAGAAAGKRDEAKNGNTSKEEKTSRLKKLASRIKNTRTRTKAGVGGILGVGALGVAGLLGAGSFQAIHLSQLLSLDNAGNERSSKLTVNALFRYARSGGDVGETRVTYLGSRTLHKAQRQLTAIGVDFEYDKRVGLMRGVAIDMDRYPATRNLPANERREAMTRELKRLGFNTGQFSFDGGRVVTQGELSAKLRRAISRDAISNLDSGKISSYLKFRQLKKFYNLPSLFHPFRFVDEGISKRVQSYDAARKVAKEQKKTSTISTEQRDSAFNKIRDRTTGVRAAAGGALLFTGSVCLARGIAEDVAIYNRQAIVLPQALEAANAIAIGAQQQSGQDFSASQLAVNNMLMTDPDGKSIWDSKELNERSNPGSSGGEVLPDKYDQAFNENTSANKLRNIGGGGGDALCSTGGQIAQGVAGLALLGISIPSGGLGATAYAGLKTLGGAAASLAAMNIVIDVVSDSLKGEAIPEDIAAPVRGSLLAYGSRELSNTVARSGGGVRLSNTESAAVDAQTSQENQRDFLSRPLYAKIFDANDYRSVTGQLITEFGNPQKSVQAIATTFKKLGSSMASTITGIIPAVHADTKADYGFNRYGIPERIMNNPDFADPYENADIAAVLLNDTDNSDGVTGKDRIERAKNCFGTTITKNDGRWGVTTNEEVNPYSGTYENSNCDAAGDTNWDRIIKFVHDSTEMESVACYLGEEEACENIGITTSQNICSIDGSTTTATTSVKGLPDWVKMPVVNAQAGGPVKGNIDMFVANIKEGSANAPSLRIMAGNNPDFIALNEVGETSLEAMESAAPGYGAYRERQQDQQEGGGERSLDNAVMWRKDTWNFVTGGRVVITDNDQTIFDGQNKTWDRFATWAVFKRKSDGAIVPVIVTHAMTNPAKFPKQWGNPPQSRIQQYSQSMDVLIQLVGTLNQFGPVLVAGDMNHQTSNDGQWTAVSKLATVGYGSTNGGSDVIYAFNPAGTKLNNVRKVDIPIGDDHGGKALSVRFEMNNVGPGSAAGVPTAVTSSTDCPEGTLGSGASTPGSVKMEDDYARECNESYCTGQCVAFVKFRLKKYIDQEKFDTLGNGHEVTTTLAEVYGYRKDNTPAVNSVVSWPPGGVTGSSANDAYGHVAMVSQVNADGSIVVEEYNATIPAETYSVRKFPASVAKLLSYAHTEVDFK